MIRTLFLAAIGSAFLCASASAADLPSRNQPYAPAGAVAAAAPYDWNGFYAGVNAGYGWSSLGGGAKNLFKAPSGAVLGGQLGFNYQSNRLLLGLEGDLYWSGMSGSRNFAGPITTKAELDWAMSLRGRAGFAADRALVYLTAGYSFGKISTQVSDTTIPAFLKSSDMRGGWVLGAGIEYAFTDNISFKTEYLYTSYSQKTILGAPYTTSSRISTSILRAGVNYHF